MCMNKFPFLKNEEKLIETHSQTPTTRTGNYAPQCCLLMLVEFAHSLLTNKTNKQIACVLCAEDFILP